MIKLNNYASGKFIITIVIMAHYAPFLPGPASIYPHNMTPMQTSMRPGRYDISVHEDGETIPAILVVDSAQRNRDAYENPGRYTFRLPKQYTEVTSIELIQANVPCSGYAINETNNVVHMIIDSLPYTFMLPPGNYNQDDLAAELQLAINTAAGLDNTDPAADRFTVIADVVKRVFYVSSPSTPSLSFSFKTGYKNNADQILGLSLKDNLNTASFNATVYELYMPYSFSLTTDPYIILSIQGMERCDSNNDAAQGAFCIIPLDLNNNFSLSVINDNEPVDNDAYIYYFPEPLPKLGKLDITFYRTNGSIYDFNGRDHFLVFRITCKSRQKKP